MIEPEHELVNLCRRIAKENPDFLRISFEVVRDEEERQKFSIVRKSEDRDAD